MLVFYGESTFAKSMFDGEQYWATDSSERNGPSYDFEDISLTGLSVSLSDDSISRVNIGFDFIFYNEFYNALNISSNGYISFSSTGNGCCSGEAIPGASALKGGVAAWWEDLNPSAGGSVHYQTFGDAPNRYFVVQFTSVPNFPSNGDNTFQYKFFESDGAIEVHYESLYGGGLHTVGIQSNDASRGIEYFRDSVSGQDSGVPFKLPFAIKYTSNNLVGYILEGDSNEVDISRHGEGSFEITLYNFSDSAIDFHLDYLNPDIEYLAESDVNLEASFNGFSSVKVKVVFPANSALIGSYNFPVNITAQGVKTQEYSLDISLNFAQVFQLTNSMNWGAEGVGVSQNGLIGTFITRDDLDGLNFGGRTSDVFYYDSATQIIDQVTNNNDGTTCSESVISGDGFWIAGICDGSGDAVLFIYDVVKKEYKRVSKISRELVIDSRSIAINHDGTKLLFISEFNPLQGETYSASMNVYSYERTGEVFRRLSDFNAGLATASLSMDYAGQNYVVSSKGDSELQNSDRSYEVFMGSLEHGITKQLTHSQFDSLHPVISGDGYSVAFDSPRVISDEGDESSPSHVYKMNVNTGGIEALTASEIYDSILPTINFDGSKIAFVSQASLDGNNSASNPELFLKDYKQNSLMQLTEINADYGVRQPRISQDGSKVYFSGAGDWEFNRNPDNVSQIFVVEGLEKRRVYVASVDEDSAKVLTGINIVLAVDDEEGDTGLGSINPYWLLFMSLIFLRRTKSLKV